MECDHRGGSRELGLGEIERVGSGRLHSADDGGRRLSSNRIRDRRYVGARDLNQPVALATPLCSRQAANTA